MASNRFDDDLILETTQAFLRWLTEAGIGITSGAGDPNGVVSAPLGSAYLRSDVPGLYVNSDGLSSWSQTYLGVSGGVVEATGAAYTVVAGNRTVLVNPTALVAPAIQLPPAASFAGRLDIKDSKGVAHTYPITILPDGAELIDGGPSLTIDGDWASVTLVVYSGAWYIV